MLKRQAALARYNLPEWLYPKLGPLLSKAENRETFLARIAQIYPPMDERYKRIERAYDTAKNAFRNIKRDGGDRYFEHLRAVTLFLIVYLRVRDPDIIIAALLHDIVEDCVSQGWTLRKVEQEFGSRVALLVGWVTKPPVGPEYPTKDEVDRKYHRMLGDAPREAVLIKVVDRLHNLITMWNQARDRMRRKVAETRDFILPLAEEHQLLIHELEDVIRLIEKRYRF